MDSQAMKVVSVNKVPIELYKILDFENLVENKPAAHKAIADGKVKLNGLVETQIRKKVLIADVIEYGETKLKIELRAEPKVSKKKVRKH